MTFGRLGRKPSPKEGQGGLSRRQHGILLALMSSSRLRRGVALLAVLVCTLSARASDRVLTFKQFLAGVVTNYDLSFSFSQSMPPDVEASMRDAFTSIAKDNGLQLVVRQPEQSVDHYDIKRSPLCLWIRRISGRQASALNELGPDHLAMGWVSNIFWTVRDKVLTLDYDQGRTYSGPTDILRDVQSPAVAPLAFTTLLAEHLGVPAVAGGIVWSGDTFDVADVLDDTKSIRGTLYHSGNPTTLAIDRVPTQSSDITNIHTSVTVSYSSQTGEFPTKLVICDEIMSKTRASQIWTKVLNDLCITVAPERDEAALSPDWFIRTYPNVVHVTVISNGWAHTAFRGGRWVAEPDYYRPGSNRTDKPVATWLVRLALVALLLAPMAMATRHRLRGRVRVQCSGN